MSAPGFGSQMFDFQTEEERKRMTKNSRCWETTFIQKRRDWEALVGTGPASRAKSRAESTFPICLWAEPHVQSQQAAEGNQPRRSRGIKASKSHRGHQRGGRHGVPTDTKVSSRGWETQWWHDLGGLQNAEQSGLFLLSLFYF